MSHLITNDESAGSSVKSKSTTETKDGSNDGGVYEDPRIELDISEKPEIEAHEEQVRILLWSYPRTVSTAFVRSITMIPKIKIFNELYSAAFFMGPNRKNKWFPLWAPSYTYKHCKDRLESKQPDHDLIFAKEFALDMHLHFDWIPKGYRHTLLIRHPLKVYPSLKKMLCSSWVVRTTTRGARIRTLFPVDWYFNRDLWELYQYLKDTTGQTPIIMDASDLIEDPETMMRWYCETTGITFHPQILTWNQEKLRRLPWEMPRIINFANWLVGCYKNALNSSGFIPGGVNKENKANKKGRRRNKKGSSDIKDASSEADNNDSGKAEVTNDSAQGAAGGRRVNPPLSMDFEQLDMTGHTQDVVEAVREDLPYYKTLYDLRTSLDDIKRMNMKHLSTE